MATLFFFIPNENNPPTRCSLLFFSQQSNTTVCGLLFLFPFFSSAATYPFVNVVIKKSFFSFFFLSRTHPPQNTNSDTDNKPPPAPPNSSAKMANRSSLFLFPAPHRPAPMRNDWPCFTHWLSMKPGSEASQFYPPRSGLATLCLILIGIDLLLSSPHPSFLSFPKANKQSKQKKMIEARCVRFSIVPLVFYLFMSAKEGRLRRRRPRLFSFVFLYKKRL